MHNQTKNNIIKMKQYKSTKNCHSFNKSTPCQQHPLFLKHLFRKKPPITVTIQHQILLKFHFFFALNFATQRAHTYTQITYTIAVGFFFVLVQQQHLHSISRTFGSKTIISQNFQAQFQSIFFKGRGSSFLQNVFLFFYGKERSINVFRLISSF